MKDRFPRSEMMEQNEQLEDTWYLSTTTLYANQDGWTPSSDVLNREFQEYLDRLIQELHLEFNEISSDLNSYINSSLSENQDAYQKSAQQVLQPLTIIASLMEKLSILKRVICRSLRKLFGK